MKISNRIPIEIPDEGKLETIPPSLSSRFNSAKLCRSGDTDSHCLLVSLGVGESHWSGPFRESQVDELYLVWIPMRGEWVAVHQETHISDDFSWRSPDGITPDGPFRQDEFLASFNDRSNSWDEFHGPYAMDKRCEDILRKAEIYRDSDFERSCLLFVPDFGQVDLELIEHFSRHPDDLQKLDWRKFEELLEAIFRNQGFQTVLGPGRADGGIDLRLLQKDSIGQIVTLVQAKRYRTEHPIRLEAVAALYGIVEAEGANRGLFVTTSRYLPAAHRFAEKHKLRLLLAASADIAEWCRRISVRVSGK